MLSDGMPCSHSSDAVVIRATATLCLYTRAQQPHRSWATPVPAQINEAVVVAVGPGRRNTAGTLVPMSVKEGDKVVLPDYGGTPVKLGEDEYVFGGTVHQFVISFISRMLVYREDELIGVLSA